MKNILKMCILATVLWGCQKEHLIKPKITESTKIDTTKMCGCKNPKTELPWLKRIIAKAEADTLGSDSLSKGYILYKKWDDQERFEINIPILFGCGFRNDFNCEDNYSDIEFSNTKIVSTYI